MFKWNYPFTKQETKNDCVLACITSLHNFFYPKNHLTLKNIKEKNTNIEINKTIEISKMKNLFKCFNLKITHFQISFKKMIKLTIKNPLLIQKYNSDTGYHTIIIYKNNIKKKYFLVHDSAYSELRWIRYKEIEDDFIGIVSEVKKFYFAEKIIIKKSNNLQKWKRSIRKIYKFLKVFSNYFSTLSLILILSLILSFINFFIQLNYKFIFNEITTINNLKLIWFFILLLILFQSIKNIFSQLLDLIVSLFKKNIYRKMINNYHHTLFSLKENSWKENDNILLKLVNDITIITEFITSTIINLFDTTINFILGLLLFFSFGYILFIYVFSIILSFFFLNYLFFRHNIFKQEKWNKYEIIYQNKLLETILAWKDIAARNLNKILLQKIRKNFVNLENCFLKIENRYKQKQVLTNFLIIFFNILILIYFLQNMINGKFTIGQFVFINFNISTSINFSKQLSIIMENKIIINKSFKRITDFFKLENKTSKIINNNKNLVIKNIKKSKFLKIKNLNYKFTKSGKNIFSGLNLLLTKKTLIYGKNGCGKTTLLKIIAQRIGNYFGEIYLENNEQKSSLNKAKIIYLDSHVYIHRGTIYENIFSFEISHKKQKLFYNLDFHKILKKVNLNLNTYTYDNGINLSKGQKQIIVFLSIFFNDWDIIILDENLNNINEKIKDILLKTLFLHFKDTFIIYVSQNPKKEIAFKNKINLWKIIC